MENRQRKLILALVFTFVCFFQYSQSAIQSYQLFQIGIPLQYNQAYFISAKQAKWQVLINGANVYKHIAFIGSYLGKSKTDTSLHVPDVYESNGTVNGNIRQYVYIIEAPGLVKIQMAIFGNGMKSGLRFYLGAQFDRGYTFIQVYTGVACKMKINVGSRFSLFTNKIDAFNQSLSQLASPSIINITKIGKSYIRLRHDTTIDISNNNDNVLFIDSFSDSYCQSQCPYGNFAAVYQTTNNFCKCAVSTSFFNQQTRICTSCSGSNTATQCTQITSQICGNGIKQGSQVCDNENEPGCINCTTVDAGFICIENQFNQTSCSSTSTSPSDPSQKIEQNESIQSRNRIIIGVCVGVGGGILVGLATFFIVKYLKAKAQLSQTFNVSQDKALENKKQESGSIIL